MKKVTFYLMVFACLLCIAPEIYSQSDLLNKGKNLIKKKDKEQTQNQNQVQNSNQTQNQNSNTGQGTQQSGFSSDDCAFYAKQFEKHIDAMEYQFEKQSDYSGSKALAMEDLQNLKGNCKLSDYEALEKRFNDLLAKIEGAEKPAKDKEALWAEHEMFMQQLRNDLYDYYNEIFKADYALSNSERLLIKAKSINYTERAIHADSICRIVYTPEELNKGTIYSNYYWIAKTFWDLYATKVKNEIEPAIQECIANANKEKASGGKWVTGKDWAQAAINYSGALKLLESGSYSEGYTLGEKYEKEAKIVFEDFKSKIGAKYYTSKLHGDNAQKLVFSKKPITIKAENPADFSTEFNAGDNIYAMGYFDTDLASFCGAGARYNVSVFIDTNPGYTGQGDFGVFYPLTPANGKNSYSLVELFPAFTPDNQDGCLLMMRDFIRIMKPGKHNILVKITNENADILAKGSFILNCTADGLSKWNEMIKPFEDRELEKARMPKAVQSNPALEAQMKNVLKESYPDETPLRLVITENAWTVEKNSITGKIEYRWISTAVAQKRANGECIVYWISFKNNYENGKYGELLLNGVGDNFPIKCENVNK
ncbi:MAG: hypothetical protein U0W24_14340 [Bacteroidales bacterium]